jgi:hypothetical protein
MGPDRGAMPSGRSPELRESDRSQILAQQFDTPPGGDEECAAGGPVVVGRGRGSRQTPVLPNGMKTKGSRRPERYEMRSDVNIPLKEDSDEDDDWC